MSSWAPPISKHPWWRTIWVIHLLSSCACCSFQRVCRSSQFLYLLSFSNGKYRIYRYFHHELSCGCGDLSSNASFSQHSEGIFKGRTVFSIQADVFYFKSACAFAFSFYSLLFCFFAFPVLFCFTFPLLCFSTSLFLRLFPIFYSLLPCFSTFL